MHQELNLGQLHRLMKVHNYVLGIHAEPLALPALHLARIPLLGAKLGHREVGVLARNVKNTVL